MTAGPLTADLIGGNLRSISFEGVEVLRGLAFLVRDRNWGTPAPEISGLDLRETDGGFHLRFQALCQTPDGDLPWSAEITGSADGSPFAGGAGAGTPIRFPRMGGGASDHHPSSRKSSVTNPVRPPTSTGSHAATHGYINSALLRSSVILDIT